MKGSGFMACNWPYTCSRCKKADKLLETGGRACCTCRFWGLDIDSPVCWKKMQIMLPCKDCGEWERREPWQQRNRSA